MRYTIRHVTRFNYETPISESVMEVRMEPRSDVRQRCLHFVLSTAPASRVMMYEDHDRNIVHHFNIPGRHSRLTVTAEAFVEVSAKFSKPVHPGDTLYPTLTIAALVPQRTTGIVVMAATIHNQRGELVLSGEHKYLLRKQSA